MVLSLNQAAWIVLRRNMAEPYVARQRSEKRDAISNEHRNASDDQALDEARA